MARSLRLSLSLVALLAAGGCGGGDGTLPAATTPTSGGGPVASTPAATAPPADATQPGTGPVPMPPPETEPGEPDAGDEEAIRVPAAFVVRGGALEPPQVTVPPFLAIELSIRSADGRAHRLTLRVPAPRSLAVGPGETASLRLAGLQAGRYAIELDGRRAGALVAGGEVGP